MIALSAEWVEAGASVFAAVGTVGAVIVALWQSRQASRRKLLVECRLAIVPDYGRLIAITRRTSARGP